MDAGRSSKLGNTLAMTRCLTCSVGETQVHPVAGGDRLAGQRPALVQLLLVQRVVVQQVHGAVDQGAHAGSAKTDQAGMRRLQPFPAHGSEQQLALLAVDFVGTAVQLHHQPGGRSAEVFHHGDAGLLAFAGQGDKALHVYRPARQTGHAEASTQASMKGPGPQMKASACSKPAASWASCGTLGKPCTLLSQWITCSRCGYSRTRPCSSSWKITDFSSRLAYTSRTRPSAWLSTERRIDSTGVMPLPPANSRKSPSRLRGTNTPAGASTCSRSPGLT